MAFLESSDFEDAICKAISLGGDSDTIACITGSIAHAFYGDIPQYMEKYCRQILDVKMLQVNDEFWKKYPQDIQGSVL
jgi:ADP-ribosylglycohydrolase